MGPAERDSPLSDLMSLLAKDGQPSLPTYNRFVDLFYTSQLGAISPGVSSRESEVITSTRERPLGLGLTTYGDGLSRILAFADPRAFVRRFGARFNVLVAGETLVAAALRDP